MKYTLLRLTPFAKLSLIFLILVSCTKSKIPDCDPKLNLANKVLVFSKTTEFRHSSIEEGIALMKCLGQNNDFTVDFTENSSVFTTENLSNYKAVVWLNTTGDVLNTSQESAFESYIRSGGGFVGVHSASDTEKSWPFYGDLLGGNAFFDNHPAIQTAKLEVVDSTHPSVGHYPSTFNMKDEWYNFQNNPSGSVNVLLNIDETSYSGGTMGSPHPVAWHHTVDQGRSWYTNLGHSEDTYADSNFQTHLLEGIKHSGNF